ncbi:MAG: GNAT family N-acetyltransferase [Clostridiales bacterium]|nr:GNAT family N-acetyltransferase [Clostridiales bacterium]
MPFTVFEMEFRGKDFEKSAIECIPWDGKYFKDYQSIMNEGYFELRKAIGAEPYDCMQGLEELQKEEVPCVYLFVKDGELIGSVGVYGNELDNLIVAKKHRCKGYGRQLMLWGMGKIRESSSRPITLSVVEWNKKAKRIYDKLGFVLKDAVSVDLSGDEEKVEPWITLRPVDETNREAVLALSVREDQPFVAPNDASLKEADEANAEDPGYARPFGIYAGEKLVGFCMFAFDPEDEDVEDRYWLWRFMIDKNEQGKGYGQAALLKIIKYFKKNGADRLYLSTEPENERGLHVYHKAGFRETGMVSYGEAVLMRMLKGPNKLLKDFYGFDIDGPLTIKGKNGHGVSIAASCEDGVINTYCSGSGRFGQDLPVNPDMLFQAGSVSKPMFAITLLRYVDKGLIDLDADISSVVPEFVKKGPVTFSALLSHTAGYNVHGFPGYPANHEQLSLEDVLAGRGNSPKVRRIKPYGGQCMYSGGGITLAELAFTRITGTTLREAFQKEVAEPLGLTRTGYFQPLDEELVGNAAFGGRLGIKEDPAHGWHYYPEHAAAGLWATPTELVKVGLALSKSCRRGGFLKKATARRMLTPVMDDYGLCVNNLRGDIGEHGGWNEGFITEWMFSLREDLCVVSMLNHATDKLYENQSELVLKLFQDGEAYLGGKPGKKAMKSYCGKYGHNADADLNVDEVFLKDGDLYAKFIGEDGESESRLYRIGKNTFGRMGGFDKIEFGEDCLTVNGVTMKKL